MQFVIQVVAADEDEAAEVGEAANPLERWSGIDLPGFDTVRLSTVHALMTGDSLQEALDRYEPVYVAQNETAVLHVADELVERLAALDEEEIESFAGELAATEEFERDDWVADDVATQLTALAELAQLAESQGQVLFVWVFLVED